MIGMTDSSFGTQNLTEPINHLATNMGKLLEYIYSHCKENSFLKNNWKQLCMKVSHGVVLSRSLHNLVNELSQNQEEIDKLEFSLLLSMRLGFCTLLIWEIYKLMYTNWLKHLVEPSIVHRGTYPIEKKIEDLKDLKIFVDPIQIDKDTHEIARRVAKFATQFDVYNSYTLIGILSSARTVVYLSYNQDRYVSIEKEKVDPDNKMNFVELGKAVELLTIWRAQFAHFGDYLLACEDLFNYAFSKYPPPQFNPFNEEILKGFSSQSPIFIKYLSRLFWKLGEAIRILTEASKNIDEIFNYKIQ